MLSTMLFLVGTQSVTYQPIGIPKDLLVALFIIAMLCILKFNASPLKNRKYVK